MGGIEDRLGAVSGSHQHGESGVQWVNADSDLLSMLSLGPLCKSLRAHQGQLLTTWGLWVPQELSM